MATTIGTAFAEFSVEPVAPKRGEILTVSGRVVAGDCAPAAGLARVEFDIGGGAEYQSLDVTDADGRFSVAVLAIETGEWSARYEQRHGRRYAPSRSEVLRIEVSTEGRPLPGGESIKLVRTDFDDTDGWASLMTAIEREWYGSAAIVDIVEDREFTGLTARELLGRLPGGYPPGMLVVADTHALTTAGHELLGIDLHDEPGRQMRFTAELLVEIQVNLDLSNMNFYDFADSAAPDGVYRGFD